MGPTQPSAYNLPEMQLEQLQPFRMDGPMAVRNTIRSLVRGRALVTLHAYSDPYTFVVSKIVTHNEREIRFELRTDEARRTELLAAPRCVALAILDQVKVQFEATIDPDATRNQPDALVCSMPDHLYRIQRREAFRIMLLQGQTAHLVLRGDGGREQTYNLIDFSATGVAFEIEDGPEAPRVGDRHQHGRLEIGARPPIPVSLVVRSVRTIEPQSAGSRTRMAGAVFIDLPNEIERKIQVAVMDLERAMRRAR